MNTEICIDFKILAQYTLQKPLQKKLFMERLFTGSTRVWPPSAVCPLPAPPGFTDV